MSGILQAKKAGCPLDMGAFWLPDKFLVRAVNETSAFVLPYHYPAMLARVS